MDTEKEKEGMLCEGLSAAYWGFDSVAPLQAAEMIKLVFLSFF